MMIMEKVMNDQFMPQSESCQFNGTVGVSNHDSLGRSPFCAAPDGRMLPDIQPKMETGCNSQLHSIHRIEKVQGEEKNKFVEIFHELYVLRKRLEEQEAEKDRCVKYIASMHKWAAQMTQKTRDLESRCSAAEASAASAQNELLRMQEKIAKTLSSEAKRTRKKAKRQTSATYSESSGNNNV
jgi:hypothetical protein